MDIIQGMAWIMEHVFTKQRQKQTPIQGSSKHEASHHGLPAGTECMLTGPTG